MKLILSAVVVAFVSHISSAANVVWNSMEVTSSFPGWYSISYPYITMTGSVSGDVLTLWADAYDYMELSSSWVLAKPGDRVTVDAIQQKGSFYYSADFNVTEEMGDVRTDYPITIKDGESSYLAIISRTYKEPMDYHVAWVELRYDTGLLYANSSAIDYDGGSLMVGAIPEPSSAVLLLLGCAGLLLKQRQRKFGGTP